MKGDTGIRTATIYLPYHHQQPYLYSRDTSAPSLPCPDQSRYFLPHVLPHSRPHLPLPIGIGPLGNEGADPTRRGGKYDKKSHDTIQWVNEH